MDHSRAADYCVVSSDSALWSAELHKGRNSPARGRRTFDCDGGCKQLKDVSNSS